MPVNSTWGSAAQDLIVTTCTGEWSWKEHAAHQHGPLCAMLHSAPGPRIVIIEDHRYGIWITEPKLRSVIEQSSCFYMDHNVQAVIFVTKEDALAALLVQTYERCGQQVRFIHARSIEAAYAATESLLSAQA